MTNEEKIKNIMDGVNAAIDAMKKAGTLTEEVHAAIIDNMNHAILAVASSKGDGDMTINDAMGKYGLPNPATIETLERNWRKVLAFGNKVLLAGYFFNGKAKPCYFGAVYEFLTDDASCEGMIGLRAASGVEFEDDGHAIAWAMNS